MIGQSVSRTFVIRSRRSVTIGTSADALAASRRLGVVHVALP